MPFLLLGLSVVLSTGRNLFSKKLSDIRFGTRAFFLCQSVLFLCGAVSLVLFGKILFGSIAPITFIYAIIYGLLLMLAQWFYILLSFIDHTRVGLAYTPCELRRFAAALRA